MKSFARNYASNEIEEANDKVKSYVRNYISTQIEDAKTEVKNYTNSELVGVKDDVRSHTNSQMANVKDEVKTYIDSEDEKVERRMRDWHIAHGTITLEGSTADSARGYVYYNGRPLCAENRFNEDVWDDKAANVICKMMGFTRARDFSHDQCDFGPCPPAGIPFAMSGFKCAGSESHIVDCPHDRTVSSHCGDDGVTNTAGYDIVGVECA